MAILIAKWTSKVFFPSFLFDRDGSIANYLLNFCRQFNTYEVSNTRMAVCDSELHEGE